MNGSAKNSEEKKNPYKGRWVATLRGKVIAQGGTPEQARRAAQKTRYKEKPEILFMNINEELNFPPLFDTLRALLNSEKDVYLVGGSVRDVFLKRPVHDLDFAVKKNAIQLARKIASKLKADFYPLDSERDTGRMLVKTDDGGRMVVDFAGYRGDDLEADLRGRDFTVNAMAIDPHDLSLHDPLGGLPDLYEKVLRACSPSSFTDDPVRILRAVRLAAAFGFHILPETRQAMKAAAQALPGVSLERQRDEFFRILEGPKPAACLKALDLLGALEPVLPELLSLKGIQQTVPHVQDVWRHTLSVLTRMGSILSALSEKYDPDTASDYNHGLLVLKIGRYRQQLAEHLSLIPNNIRSWREILLFSALYHDIAKPHKSVLGAEGRIRFWGHEEAGSEIVRERAHRFALSNDEIERLCLVVQNHMRIHFHIKRYVSEKKPPTHRAIYRFFRDTGEAGVDICLLTLADVWATYENTLTQATWADTLEVVRVFLEAWWEKKDELILPPQLVSGHELMEKLSIAPGPEVGRLLEAVREAQVTKEVSDPRGALDYARSYLEKLLQGEIKEVVYVNDNKLAFFQRPGSGLPVILMHGYPLDHTIWHNLLPLLDKDAHLILPDLRGHGASQAPEGTYTIEQMAEDIAGLMDFLRLRKAILVGHSLGGYVALSFAGKYSQKTRGLGLVASRTNADTPAQKTSRQEVMADIQKNGMQPVADAMSVKLVAEARFSPGLHALIMKMEPAGAIGALAAMAERRDTSGVLAGLNAPILVVAGSADVLIPVEISRTISGQSKNITYVELEGVGHMPMLESPVRTAEAITKLIRDCSS
jgi:poly(A) polymerase